MAAAPLAIPLVIGPGIGAVGLTTATGATAALSVGTAAAAAGASAASIGTVLTTAQIGLGVIGAAVSLMGGDKAAASLEQQAELAETRATQELVIGKQQGNEVRRERIRAFTAAAAAGAASGINVGTGPIGKGLVRDIDEDAQRELKIVKSNATVGEAAQRLAAANLRSRKSGAKLQGLLGAVSSLAQTINVTGGTN